MPIKNKLRRKERMKAAPICSNKKGNTTSKSCWKGFERKVAEFFSTKRVPLSGSNSGHNTNSDSLHPKLYIECKVRSSFSIWTLFEDTESKAKNENKIPVVAIKQKGAKGYLLMIRPEHLEEILQIKNSSSEHSE